MSHALRETTPIQNLIKEIHCIFDLPNPMTDFNTSFNKSDDIKLKYIFTKPVDADSFFTLRKMLSGW